MALVLHNAEYQGAVCHVQVRRPELQRLGRVLLFFGGSEKKGLGWSWWALSRHQSRRLEQCLCNRDYSDFG